MQLSVGKDCIEKRGASRWWSTLGASVVGTWLVDIIVGLLSFGSIECVVSDFPWDKPKTQAYGGYILLSIFSSSHVSSFTRESAEDDEKEVTLVPILNKRKAMYESTRIIMKLTEKSWTSSKEFESRPKHFVNVKRG